MKALALTALISLAAVPAQAQAHYSPPLYTPPSYTTMPSRAPGGSYTFGSDGSFYNTTPSGVPGGTRTIDNQGHMCTSSPMGNGRYTTICN
jgi:hypothetical protein